MSQKILLIALPTPKCYQKCTGSAHQMDPSSLTCMALYYIASQIAKPPGAPLKPRSSPYQNAAHTPTSSPGGPHYAMFGGAV